MTSVDANLLLFAFSADSPFHEGAQKFLTGLATREDVAISEFVLTEFYLHLRNPSVLEMPLAAEAAVSVVECYRRHPRWKVVGFTPQSRLLHDDLWRRAGVPDFARRRIYDARTALTLLGHGIHDFATANVKDFADFGFRRVWNPLEERAAMPAVLEG